MTRQTYAVLGLPDLSKSTPCKTQPIGRRYESWRLRPQSPGPRSGGLMDRGCMMTQTYRRLGRCGVVEGWWGGPRSDALAAPCRAAGQPRGRDRTSNEQPHAHGAWWQVVTPASLKRRERDTLRHIGDTSVCAELRPLVSQDQARRGLRFRTERGWRRRGPGPGRVGSRPRSVGPWSGTRRRTRP